MPLRMLSQPVKFAQGVSASKHAGLAGQMICIKYSMGQKLVHQYRGFAYGDVEPDKKKDDSESVYSQ
uniref:Uncharacterized protein n=1 Tax=Ditylenchus dipsaci TaxID=166011 RepID=A0A915E131_9BILA